MKVGELGAAAHKIEPAIVELTLVMAIAGLIYHTFKDNDRRKICVFHVEVLVEIPKTWLTCCHRQQICRPVPCDIVQSFEDCRDFWNGNADNCSVYGDQKRSEVK